MIIKLKKRERIIKLTVKLLKRLILLSRLESAAKSKGRKENGCETNHANYLAEKAGTSFPRPITDFHARLSPGIGGRQLERQRADRADTALIFYEDRFCAERRYPVRNVSFKGLVEIEHRFSDALSSKVGKREKIG